MAQKVTKTAVVKALEGPIAVAVTLREPACEACAARGGCDALGGTGANATVRALNTVDAQVGDTVTIAMSTKSLLKVSFVVYMVPMLSLTAGIILGLQVSHLVGISENLAVGVLAGLALVGSFVWLRRKGRELSKRKGFTPEIIAKQQVRETIPGPSEACTLQ